MTSPSRPHQLTAAGLVALSLFTACSSWGDAGGSSSVPSAPGAPTTSPSPTAQGPGAPVSGEPASGNPPAGGGGELTVPQPGQLEVHPVAAEQLEAEVDGGRVTVRITWTSGVEPCYVLDAIAVERTGTTIALTVREGHAPGNNICIEIAQQKWALVDLGELDPGTYTISDSMGGAAPIELVVGRQ